MEQVLNKIKTALEEEGVQLQGKRILAAVSGGPDSMCMLYCFNLLKKESDFELIIAHIEHGMRPIEDPDETQFLLKIAESLNLKIIVDRLPKHIFSKKGSKEEIMREARYDSLNKIAVETKSDYIALGHQMDDQVETFLMRLLRGSGAVGLGSMKIKTGILLRPLLFITRKEILKFLETNKIPFVLDKTNEDRSFLRNKIRLELVPYLMTFQPNILERLSITAQLLGMEADYLRDIANKWLDENSDWAEFGLRFSVDNFLRQEKVIQFYILREAFLRVFGSTKGISNRHILDSTRLILNHKGFKEIHLPRGGRFYCEARWVFICGSRITVPRMKEMEISAPGEYPLPIGKLLKVEILKGLREELLGHGNTAVLDGEKVVFPLKVRGFKPGDWFIPFGMKGRKKLQDFFVDLKVPKLEREKIPLVLSGDNIVWVAGYRLDQRFKVDTGTKVFLRLSLKNLEGPFPEERNNGPSCPPNLTSQPADCL